MSKRDMKCLNNQAKMQIVQLSFAIWYRRKPNDSVKRENGLALSVQTTHCNVEW